MVSSTMVAQGMLNPLILLMVTITIWKLAINIKYKMLAGLIGIGRSTACKIVNDNARQMVTHLLPKYVKIPQEDRLKEIVKVLNSFWVFCKL